MGKINMPVVPITANQVGAVSKNGDTMNGNLVIKSDLPEFLMRRNDSDRYFNAFLEASGYFNMQNKTDANNSVNLIISPETELLEKIIMVRRAVDGSGVTYKLYGEHNKPTPSAIGAAASSHTHAAGDINSGTLGVARGGTGATTFTSGAALIGAGTGAVTTRTIKHSTTSAVAGTGNDLATCGTVTYHVNNKLNRLDAVTAANTSYTTYMARGIALVTAVPTSMTNGCFALVY